MGRLARLARLGRLARPGRTDGPTAGQRGYVLMLVLGVMALTMLTAVALLGLAFTSARITTAQVRSNLENRAADGALEAAVARMARTAGGSPCAAVPSAGGTVAFADPAGGPVNVTVQCGTTGTGDPSQLLGGPGVDVIGAEGLRHSGAAALPFDADVTVRRGADVTGPVAGPAVTATGQYVQGDPGPGGTGTACTELAAGPPARRIADRDLSPECGRASVQSLPVRSAQLASPGSTPLIASVPAPCPTGPVVRFTPGRFGPAQTAALNRLFRDCNNLTFWFQPAAQGVGVYEFDANSPSDPDVGRRDALVVDNPTIAVVFGRPLGWNPDVEGAGAAFPRACDATVPGASIQLSGRTALRQRAGRVAVCPARDAAGPLEAIVQVPTAPAAPIGTLVSTDFQDGPNLLSRSGSSARATFPSCPPGLGCIVDRSFEIQWSNLGPGTITSAKFLLDTREEPKASSAYRQAIINVRTPSGLQGTCTVPGGRTNWLTTSFDLLRCVPALAGQPATVLDGANIRVTYRYTWPCQAVEIFGQWFGSCDAVPGSPFEVVALNARAAALEINSSVASGTAAVGAAWADPTNARADDALSAKALQTDCPVTIGGLACSYETSGTERSLTISGLAFPAGDPMAGPVNVSSLYALVTNIQTGTDTLSYVSDPVDQTQTAVTLRLAGGATCTATFPGFSQSAQPTRYDLLRNGCSGLALTSSADLAGAQLTVTYRSGCAYVGGVRWQPDESGRCGTLTVPTVQFAGLVATTDTVTGTTPRSEVNVDVAGGREFHVFGDSVMPRTGLDVRWWGTARSATELVDTPLYGGSLVIQGLTSSVQGAAITGVVCCTPPGGGVRLRAVIDGQVRAEAAVEVQPTGTGPAGRPVKILDWRICSGSCTAPAAAQGPGTPPP